MTNEDADRHARSPLLWDGAACKGYPTWWWFCFPRSDDTPVASLSEMRVAHNAAVNVCAECPLQVQCAEWGLRNEKYGTWGGLSPYDRYALGGRGVEPKNMPLTARMAANRIIARFGKNADAILRAVVRVTGSARWAA